MKKNMNSRQSNQTTVQTSSQDMTWAEEILNLVTVCIFWSFSKIAHFYPGGYKRHAYSHWAAAASKSCARTHTRAPARQMKSGVLRRSSTQTGQCNATQVERQAVHCLKQSLYHIGRKHLTLAWCEGLRAAKKQVFAPQRLSSELKGLPLFVKKG